MGLHSVGQKGVVNCSGSSWAWLYPFIWGHYSLAGSMTFVHALVGVSGVAMKRLVQPAKRHPPRLHGHGLPPSSHILVEPLMGIPRLGSPPR